MKVSFILSGNVDYEAFEKGYIGGTEYQVWGLSKEIIRKGHEVLVISGCNKEAGITLLNGINIVKIKIPIKNTNFRVSPLKALFSRIFFSRMARLSIEKINPDFIFMTEPLSSYFISTVNIPKAFITHNFPYGMLRFFLNTNCLVKSGLSLLEKMETNVLLNSNIVIALNKAIERFLLLKGLNKVLTIPNGVEIDNNIKPYDGGYILYGGRLSPEKGVLYLLQAYKKLCEEERISQKLIIVGSGPQEYLLKQYARSIKGRVVFIPWLTKPNFMKVLARCSIYVLPSLYECSPVSLLEAMSFRKPVIASDVPGSQDVINHEYNGFLFKARDINKLKEYLKLLILNPDLGHKIGQNAFETILKKYTFEKIAERYINLIERIIRHE